MAKLTLDFEEAFELDFLLIGIACHIKDYRLAYCINKALDWDLRRTDDLDLFVKNEQALFSMYEYQVEEDLKSYHLISNRSDKGLLIPERKESDFFIQLYGEFTDEQFTHIKKEIQKIKFVLTSFEIDPSKLKSGNNLLI